MDAEGAVQLPISVRATLEPYAVSPDRLELAQAPEVALSQDQVVPVSLILYELATYALKYGALSTPAGHLRIGWRIETPNGTQTSCASPGERPADLRHPLQNRKDLGPV